MANEITVSQQLSVTNGYASETFNVSGVRINQAAVGAHSPVWIIGTSEEDMAVGDVTTLGWLCLRNLDTTNYITYGPKSGGSMVALGRLNAGESCMLRLEPGVTLRAIANTAAVKVKQLLLQN